MCFAYVLLIFNISFFAGMSALIIIRARQEAKKTSRQKHSCQPSTETSLQFLLGSLISLCLSKYPTEVRSHGLLN
jgi:hypothetical protein